MNEYITAENWQQSLSFLTCDPIFHIRLEEMDQWESNWINDLKEDLKKEERERTETRRKPEERSPEERSREEQRKVN